MTPGYVWLVCGIAIVVLDLVLAIALRGRPMAANAVAGSEYLICFVAGVGAGRLRGGARLWRAVGSGLLAGAVTGAIGATLGRAAVFALDAGVAPASAAWSRPASELVAVVTALTGACLGAIGAIVGWAVRRTAVPDG